MKRLLGCDYSSELDFVSSHFYELCANSKQELEKEDLEQILNSGSLLAESEDKLYEMISVHFGEGIEWFELLEFIRFEFLSVLCISDLIEWMKNESIDISGCIWSSLCHRLMIDISRIVEPRFPVKRLRKGEMEIELNPASPLSGIIANLTSRFGGNVSDLGIVSVTSKSVHASYPPKNAVDLTADSKFLSQNAPDQWLCYDFLDRQVEVRNYSIRSQFDYGSGGAHPKSWVIEGSVDGENWTELDSRINNSELDAQNVTKTWRTTERMQSRYVRLRQTALNHCGSNYLIVSALELFGSLFE
jgi:hypothetical protein